MKGQAIATRYPLFLQKTMNSTHPKSADSDCAYSAWNAKSIFPRNWSSFQHYMGWSRQFLTWAAFTTWWAPQDQSSNCAPIYSMPSVQRIFQDFSKTWSTCYPKSIEHLSNIWIMWQEFLHSTLKLWMHWTNSNRISANQDHSIFLHHKCLQILLTSKRLMNKLPRTSWYTPLTTLSILHHPNGSINNAIP